MKARRLPVVDEYVEGGQMAVLVDGQLVVLSLAATTALCALGDEWSDLSVVCDGVVRALGEPPAGTPEEAVASILAELVDAGLVQTSDTASTEPSRLLQEMPQVESN